MIQRIIARGVVGFSLCTLLLLSGCSTVNMLLKADPAEPSGFIENPEQMQEMREHAPFHGLWFKDRAEFDRTRSKFKKIYFQPIATTFIQEKGWWSNLNEADFDQYQEDLVEMATYMKEEFEKAFEEDPAKRFVVTQVPDSQTVIYSIALVELIATKAHINALGTVAGAMVPGGGLMKSTAKGSIAIEVKVIDGETDEVIITWADREMDRSSLFNVNDFSWYSHARKHVDDWAEQLVMLHNVTTSDYVEDSSGFTLNPF